MFEKIRDNKKFCWFAGMIVKYLLVVFVLVACVLAGARIGQKKALDTYAVWIEEYKEEQRLLAIKQVEEDPYTIQLNEEADMLAKVLYGVKENSTDDLRTYCWCVFNRVENKSFPDTLQDVIEQPNQWMRYDPTNPILENLFKVAREELDRWHTDSHRPVSSDYVFMTWSSKDIVLRDVFSGGSGTHYWRYS